MKTYSYYRELTAAEVGETSTHEIYIRFPNNFDYETFFHGAAVENGTVIEVSFEALDLTDQANNMVSFRFVHYNSNNENRIPSLKDLFESHQIKQGDIVCLESRIDNDNVSYFLRFYKKGEIEISPSSVFISRNDNEPLQTFAKEYKGEYPLQQIYYGAPGTGKSHIINKTTCSESVIRTTFHPDSDYSTFVGCYKPTTKTVKMRDLSGHVIKDDNGEELTEDRIVYEFVDQAFLQAYIQAWKFYDAKNEEIKKQYLVIEEINRGNCAQIFGDLFQLLDRNTYGFSDYPIQADNDMRKQLAKAFKDITISEENKSRINACYKGGKDYVSQVLKGEILLLPDNFYIWATMNTSDQSLFPIDSAFKRRWDWQYMPIAKGREEGKELNWIIEADTNEYDWWSFLTKINEQIGSTTNSEDKKLGFFFCKAKNGKISAETFVGKVIFYLWNDVFKDFGFEGTIFNDEDGSTLSFDKFYSTNNEGKVVVNKDKVQRFLDNLEVDAIVDSDEPGDNNAETGFTRRHIKVVWPDGKIMENNNSTTTLIDVINAIGPAKVAELGMKISGYDLLSREKIGHNKGGYGDSQRPINDGYWLVTKFSTDAKLAKLQEMSSKLNLDLKVSVEG